MVSDTEKIFKGVIFMFFNEKALQNYEHHVRNFNEDFVKKGKRPRAKDWQPVRFAVRDNIVGLLVSRHHTKENIIEVDVFITMDPQWINGYSGTKMATLSLLCDAYKCGSNMGIRFTQNVENGTIPLTLDSMADDLGIELKFINQGFITPKESRQLFLALTDFKPKVKKRIMELSISNLIVPERICYLVHHGVFSIDEMESILLNCHHPERVLNGTVGILNHLYYSEIILQLRLALLGGALDTKLRLKEVYEKKDNDNEVYVDIEANDNEFNLFFDQNYGVKVYSSKENCPTPWVNPKYQNTILSEGTRAIVLPKAYDFYELKLKYGQCIKILEKAKEQYIDETKTNLFLLVPNDVEFINPKELEEIRAKLYSQGITLMIYPKSIEQIDVEVQKKIHQMTLLRHDLSAIGERQNITGSNFNNTKINFVALHSEIQDNNLASLPKSSQQLRFDTGALKTGVNQTNVEHRILKSLDQIGYLARYQLSHDQSSPFVIFSQDFLEEIQKFHLTNIFYTQEEIDKIIPILEKTHLSKDLSDFLNFLKTAQKNGRCVAGFLDKTNLPNSKGIDTPLKDDQIIELFNKEVLPDKVVDYSHQTFKETIMSIILESIESKKQGVKTTVNLGNFPHQPITEALNDLIYQSNQYPAASSVDIIYTDNTEARPFPLFQVLKRQDSDFENFKTIKPMEIGMMSCRHSSLDYIIDRYWIRNIEINIIGDNSAQKDEFTYQETKKKLSEITKNNQFVRINFYHTGFTPVIIGFYRAVAEFLIENKDQKPCLEIIPKIVKSQSKNKKILNKETDFDSLNPWH